jgi:uncharacterized OB-fold protein
MAELPVVRTREQAKAHDPNVSALVEVPGEFVPTVVWLMEALQQPSDSQVGKVVRSLLRSKGRRE